MFVSAVARLSLGLAALSAVSAKMIEVQVGSANGDLTYSPEAVSADVGDQVVFTFHQKNHTATQSSLAAPCSLEDGGLDSGFMPVAANQTDNFPTWTVNVMDTKPMWFFCAQAANTPASHCGKGMVFAINCGPDGAANSFTNFKNSALAIGAQLVADAAASSMAATQYSGWSTTADAPAYTDSASAAYGGYSYGSSDSTSAAYGYGGDSSSAAYGYGATMTTDASAATDTASSTASAVDSAASAASTGTGSVIKVVVGGSDGELTFSPSNVTAQINDVIEFEFHQKNHTATQSSFGTPCNRLTDQTSGAVIGLDSGFMPVDANATTFPTWSVTVNNTQPLWFYCRQHAPTGASHCGAGMVFAVNAVADGPKNFTAFTALAKSLNGTTLTSNTTGSSSADSGAVGMGLVSPARAALSLGALVAAAAVLL